jgi:hypothetical protein
MESELKKIDNDITGIVADIPAKELKKNILSKIL